MYKKNQHFHFVGIGGIGMSALALILKAQGKDVSGCDTNTEQETIKNLTTQGCSIFTASPTHHCTLPDNALVIYSTAVKKENPDLVYAHKHNIKTIHRSLMLAELMRTKHGIAISGSHGKTTTSSMIAHLLLTAGLDPSLVVGGIMHDIASNAHLGTGDFFIAEADESDRSLLVLKPSIGILTSVDLEHLETYHNLFDIMHTYKQFLDNLPFYGTAFVCYENPELRALLPLSNARAYTYGLSHKADFHAQDVIHFPDHSTYTAYKGTYCLGPITIAMPGIHNVLNSLAAVALGYELDIEITVIQKALSTFKGIDRRFTFKGYYNQTAIYDDYGHHPLEIKHTIQSARRKTSGSLGMLFQPHRYTRTQKLWHDFINTFAHSELDYLVITDIYAASETALENVTSQNLVQEIQKTNPKLAVFYAPLSKNYTELKAQLYPFMQNTGLLILQGAGKVNALAHDLIENKLK